MLSENKLKELIDFANYLKITEEREDLLGMQMRSKTYIDCLISENDVYDEVFKGEFKEE